MTSLKITKLSNGLRVVTDNVASVESVAVGVWIGVGTRDEDLIHNGTAHMVEHMLFKGTKTRNALEIAKVIENVGGHINAYTSRELTSYHIHLLKDDLPLAVDVLSDIVQHSTMPEDEIERERNVILQEIGMCHDTPDDIIFDNYFETAYPKQSFGAPILGTNQIIEGMSRETLMDFTKQLYTPSNMVICASGNIDHDRFIQKIEEKFNALPDDTEQMKTPTNYHGGEHRESRDLEQSHVILGFNGVSRVSDDYYAAQTLATLMGGGMSSRLFQEVREKRGLVYSIYSFHSAHSDGGQFGIYAGTGPDKLPELIPVICDEVKKIGTTITSAELSRAKAQLRSSILIARESMMSRADQNAKAILLRGSIRSPEDIIERIDAVNIKALKKVAGQIFSSAPTLAALGPLGALESFDKIKVRLTSVN
ncbi:MAG: peptidase M16 [Alphaproteobacteria bacterium]|nr:MAG: peptidase M16 [Alphaproteobacteria bacterium]